MTDNDRHTATMQTHCNMRLAGNFEQNEQK